MSAKKKEMLGDITNKSPSGTSSHNLRSGKRRSTDEKKKQAAFVEAVMPNGEFVGWGSPHRGRAASRGRGTNSSQARGQAHGQERQPREGLQGGEGEADLQEGVGAGGADLQQLLNRSGFNITVTPRRRRGVSLPPRHS